MAEEKKNEWDNSGMSNWVRLWEDMPTDPKWLVVRSRALQRVTGVSIVSIIGLFAYMLAKADKDGDLVNWSNEDVAAWLEMSTEQVAAIFEAMQGKVLEGNHLTGWNNRQPKREDLSTQRVRAFRERCNALERSETHQKRRDSESEYNSTPRACAREGPNSTQKVSKRGIREDETPTEQQVLDAEKYGLNTAESVEAEFERFRDYNLAKGTSLADWDAAWRNWLAKVHDFVPKKALVSKANGHAAVLETVPPATISKQLIYILEGTPQWKAWDEYWRKVKGVGPPKDYTKDGGAGWWFETEYPPNREVSA